MRSELLIKFLLKEVTQKESELVENWINASDKNKRQFLDFKRIWEESKALTIAHPQNQEVAWEKFRLKTEKLKSSKKMPQKLNIFSRWQQIAAALIIGFLCLWGYNQYHKSTFIEILSKNKISRETLPDGTLLTLNKNAQISYEADFKQNRNIKMDIGEVFFEVKKDNEHPFVIDIEQLSVKVVGTSFNIKNTTDFIQINVESGIVKVSLADIAATLVKGEKIVIKTGSKELIKEKYTDHLYNYYRTKLFSANNIKLAILVATLNEAYGANISLDERAKELTISTTLKMGSLEENLQIICETLNLSSSRNGSDILLSYQDK